MVQPHDTTTTTIVTINALFCPFKKPAWNSGSLGWSVEKSVLHFFYLKTGLSFFILLSYICRRHWWIKVIEPILDTLWLWGQFGDFVELKGWVWPLFVELKEHGFDHWHYGKDGDVGVPDPVSLTADNCEKGCDQIVTKSQSHRAIVNEQVQLVRRGRLYADYIVHCFNMNLSTMHYGSINSIRDLKYLKM